jgi:pyruvate/2-oxoglutarate/acetoin dehydrogenase E1 component
MLWDESLVADYAVQQPNDVDTGERIVDYTTALNEALQIKLVQDSNTFVLGQGATDPGHIFGVTKHLKEKFGSERIFDIPVSEEGLMGVCVGAAMQGKRPIYLHNRPDFILLAFNQLINHAAKMHFMDAGQTQVPLVIWSAIGRGWGSGPQHSQSIHGLLMGVPGLKMIMPSTPYDAKGLMISAIEDNNPVLIFEHRWLMRCQGPVPKAYYKIPIGKGVKRREGNELTIVGCSQALSMALEAINTLEKEGAPLSVDVIDLRTIQPLDEEIIVSSVNKTGKLLIVDNGWKQGGLSAEIAALVSEKAFSSLKAPIKRIGFPHTHIPAGDVLERIFFPSVNTVAQQIRNMLLTF